MTAKSVLHDEYNDDKLVKYDVYTLKGGNCIEVFFKIPKKNLLFLY